ncbi:MAG: 23S rRNA (adenine(2030)-N(6))-methyltransferase RlmJ [Steroidobacteraceae bacterium]
MNYRHAFHAGNFADVHKHVILTALLDRLTGKPTPLLYLDTHAGRGLYDFKSIEAARGREWQAGVERLRAAPLKHPLLRRYRELIAAQLDASQYPGSPLLALQSLRPDDRAVLVEKQTDEARLLRTHLTRTRHVSVLAEDGYIALKAQLPPKEKRGLVLVDPPYEDAQEFQQLERALTLALSRWPQAVMAIWYPLKAGAATDRWFQALQTAGLRKLLLCELAIRPRDSAVGLNGSGVLITNPPYQLEIGLKEAHAELLPLLAEAPHAGDQSVRWLVEE